jgi:chromosome segregation ATPase
VQQLTAQLQTTTTQLEQNKTQLSQTQGSLQQSQGQAKQLTSGLDQCRGDNAQLYQLSTDLLTRYENKGWREVVGAKEPFFQYARVRLENTKAQYQDKIEAARHTSSNTPTQPAP